ncbi:MAG: DUF6717 family protein [Turicibacter sp.]
MKIQFFKDPDGRWYADLMDTLFISKEECEMILGADKMLDIISEGESKITLSLKADVLENPTLINMGETSDGGCDYLMMEWKGVPYQYPIWLCSVTQMAFGRHPNNFKITKVS